MHNADLLGIMQGIKLSLLLMSFQMNENNNRNNKLHGFKDCVTVLKVPENDLVS